jgi:hypothetical protein
VTHHEFKPRVGDAWIVCPSVGGSAGAFSRRRKARFPLSLSA